jgi:hypothetical protein
LGCSTLQFFDLPYAANAKHLSLQCQGIRSQPGIQDAGNTVDEASHIEIDQEALPLVEYTQIRHEPRFVDW